MIHVCNAGMKLKTWLEEGGGMRRSCEFPLWKILNYSLGKNSALPVEETPRGSRGSRMRNCSLSRSLFLLCAQKYWGERLEVCKYNDANYFFISFKIKLFLCSLKKIIIMRFEQLKWNRIYPEVQWIMTPLDNFFHKWYRSIQSTLHSMLKCQKKLTLTWKDGLWLLNDLLRLKLILKWFPNSVYEHKEHI